MSTGSSKHEKTQPRKKSSRSTNDKQSDQEAGEQAGHAVPTQCSKSTSVASVGTGVEFNEDDLYKEIEWCIGQLELGLSRQNPSSRQAQESQKIIRILKSGKAPLVKKRQAMRNTFGDYRKKMKEEEKRTQASLRNTVFKPSEKINKSLFFRKSNARTYSQMANNSTEMSSKEDKKTVPASKIARPLENSTDQSGVESLVTEFKFAFRHTDTENSEGCVNDQATQEMRNTNELSATDQTVDNSKTLVDYFKNDRNNGTNFCFNFQLDDL